MTETQSNRPKDNALFQQKLKAWKPLLTFKDASIFFIVTGVIVLAIGIGIFIPDSQVQEYLYDYTDCIDTKSNQSCASIDKLYNISCTCTLSIQIKTLIPAPVYFYYGMVNFYQNHRQLIKSYDMAQLMGKNPPGAGCQPLLNDNSGKYYAPCGQMANVIFNDTFNLYRNIDNTTVPWSSVNIALSSDKKRYGTPTTWNNTVRPPNWQVPINVRSPNAYAGDEELMVWMRPAALPKFRKLYRILSASDNFTTGLPAGNYTISVNYSYPVKIFGGQKYFIITNLSWIGGKNAALGILYLVTGCLEIVIGIVLVILYCKYPRKQDRQNSFDMSSYL